MFGSIPNLLKMNLKGTIIDGFVSPSFAKTVVDHTAHIVKEQKLPFGVVVVKGDPNTPISWASHEHGYSCNGDNDYVFVILPDGRLINFLAVANQDTYS